MGTSSKWYTFIQNNSDGSFYENESSGVGAFVIIEAESADHANSRAKSIGIYFGGVEHGLDCGCCGDRWRPVSESGGEDSPMIFDDPVGIGSNGSEFIFCGTMSFIHPLSGKFGAARVAK